MNRKAEVLAGLALAIAVVLEIVWPNPGDQLIRVRSKT